MIDKTNFDEQGILKERIKRNLERSIFHVKQELKNKGIPEAGIRKNLEYIGTELIKDSEKAIGYYRTHY